MLLFYVVQEHFGLLHENKSLPEPFTCLSTQEDRSCSQPEYATKFSFQLLNPRVDPFLKVHSLYIKMILTFANPKNKHLSSVGYSDYEGLYFILKTQV